MLKEVGLQMMSLRENEDWKHRLQALGSRHVPTTLIALFRWLLFGCLNIQSHMRVLLPAKTALNTAIRYPRYPSGHK